MPNRTNVDGSIDIQSKTPFLHVTLRPEWGPLLDRACAALRVTRVDCLRRAVEAFPDAGRPEALRLFIAATVARDTAEAELARALEGLQIPLPPYVVPA